MKKLWIVLIVFAAVVGISNAIVSGRRKAVRINRVGAGLRDERRYAEAAEQFRQATVADPTYATAHYNLACAFAQRYAENRDGAALREIYRQLEETLRYDNDRREKMKTEPALASVQAQARFLILTRQADVTKEGDVLYLLHNFSWRGSEATPPGWTLTFRPDRTVSLRAGGETAFTGRYAVDGNQISVVFDGAVARTDRAVTKMEGEIVSDGRLLLDGDLGPISFSSDAFAAATGS